MAVVLEVGLFELMLSGDEKSDRAILRNYINATVGFQQLEKATSIQANILMRMLGRTGILRPKTCLERLRIFKRKKA